MRRYGDLVRTTVTIDADTEALLKEEASRTGQSFKVVLNQAVKRALGRPSTPARVEPLFSAPFPAELVQQSFNRLAAEWEDEDTVKELSS
jgi:hypothetical protein